MITEVHKTGDYQSENYRVGEFGTLKIERFNIAGLHADYPRLRVTRENKIIEMDARGMTIYEETP